VISSPVKPTMVMGGEVPCEMECECRKVMTPNYGERFEEDEKKAFIWFSCPNGHISKEIEVTPR
jgi:hypothetical protein